MVVLALSKRSLYKYVYMCINIYIYIWVYIYIYGYTHNMATHSRRSPIAPSPRLHLRGAIGVGLARQELRQRLAADRTLTLHGFKPPKKKGNMAMGQKPNRTPSEHPIQSNH